jgi:two-component system, NtrC family, response regulator HydG
MSTASLNVLVVDDDMAVCRILQRMLNDEQYQVQISQSVADAQEVIEQKPFDVYVMDYKLPDGTGLDLAERIRSKGSEAPIILISGYDPSAVAVRAEKLRISDIIEKPFARATICGAVKKALAFTQPTERGLESVNGSSSKAVSTRKPFPKAAIIGAVVFLLLISCLAIYLFVNAH